MRGAENIIKVIGETKKKVISIDSHSIKPAIS